MDKKSLTETDIKTKFITPAIIDANWNLQDQIREEVYFTDGRIIQYDKTIKRGKAKKADYILYHKSNLAIAVIEAKDNKHEVGAGMQQAIDYGEILDTPFIFSSNGDGFIFHNKLKGTEEELAMDEFPNPDTLWKMYLEGKGLNGQEQEIIETDYYYEEGCKEPRYYQSIAINRTIEAIAKGRNRILLVMATGTGKTFTAFQILWRLWKSKKKKRILYLADRNVLIDQTMQNDFKPFSKVMTKVSNREADPAFQVYMALYQGLTGNEDVKNIYKNFSKDFFDLIVVDECHRGSAREDSNWRDILKYFDSATQIGMTATPKETKKVSNIDYFGEPIYEYSLKQGINDGFLAPYEVLRVSIDKDVEGYIPERGKKDWRTKEVVPKGEYGSKDYDKTLIIDERTKLVANRISEYLKNTDRFSKTIVFCVDIDHAERVRRALVNENSDLVKKDNRYIMKITGDDKEGKRQLGNFIDPSSKYPVIAVTSKLMTTGVDAQTCKLIVLDTIINSMTEFKQIIGRGTRVRTDYGKYSFTIMDFRKATNNFYDPDFDGIPIQSAEYKGGSVELPKNEEDAENKEGEVILESPDIDIKEGGSEVKKYRVKDVDVKIINEVVQYYDTAGNLITDNLKDFTKKNIDKKYRSLQDFISKWNIVDQKNVLVEELLEEGLLLGPLREQVKDGKQYDPFDLILHVAYGEKPISRKERAKRVKKDSYFDKYGQQARDVINALLDKYSDEGLRNLEKTEVLKIAPLNQYGSLTEIVRLFGGVIGYKEMLKELEMKIYA